VRALELRDSDRQHIRELEELSEKAEASPGDKETRRELRQRLRDSTPAVIARCSDISRTYRSLLADTASGKDPLVHEALRRRMEMMQEEIAGETPTPLEALLTERIVSCWMLVELFDALMAGQLWRKAPSGSRVTPDALKYYLRWQDLANKRFLASVTTLARVRKLQANTPGIQVNTQINLR
jgi:hypothetical protein